VAPTAPDAVLSRYCLTCHNERVKTAGFVIDPAGAGAAGDNAETWEKVVRKLRTTSMPPAGSPRPDAATYAAVASALEKALDGAATAHPRAGKLPLVHRLSRTEYQNAVRDLLALQDLPREVRIDYLLPADNISSGFDNIAAAVRVAQHDGALPDAAQGQPLAVGETTMPVLAGFNCWIRVIADERVDDLAGTRGGWPCAASPGHRHLRRR
jgi:hypothetical protein